MNDFTKYSTVSTGDVMSNVLPAEIASDTAPVAENDCTEEYIVKSEAEFMQMKTENFESHLSPDPLETPFKTDETGHQELQLSTTVKNCDDDGPDEDIALKNVLDLENVLIRMYAPRAGLERMDVGDDSLLENELERVMRLENVLRKVNGNLSEFKFVEETLRKIHEAVLMEVDGNESECVSSEINLGVNRMSDIELALQNDALILNDDFRESFSTIEEWASSQIKQQGDLGSPSKGDTSFSKSEGEVMKSAKVLFAKKTKTLFRWLHPKDTKADLRQRVDRAWDSLSPNETEFYYSQVLGPFNHRQVKPMINPRIFELLNIPEALRPTPSTRTDTDDAPLLSAEEPQSGKAGRSRKSPKPKSPAVGLPRRKRGPYKKTLQAMEKSKKRNHSSSSSSDREYLPNSNSKRRKDTKKKKISNVAKLRLKFFKMKTSKLPESSDSDDYNDDEDEDYDSDNPYKRQFERVRVPPDCEISAEVTQGLEECDKLLNSDCSM